MYDVCYDISMNKECYVLVVSLSTEIRNIRFMEIYIRLINLPILLHVCE